MHPICIEIGSFSIRYYGVFAAIGFILALVFLNINRRFADLSKDDASNLVFVSLVAGVLGSRIFYVIQFFEQFKGNLIEIVRIDKGGLVFYGGFFLATFSIIAYSKIKKLDIFRILDVMIPSLALGHAAGRIGCFLNGCCYGKPTELFLGVHHPEGSEAYYRYMGAAVHPVQLYEALFNIIIFAVAMVLLRKCKRGITAGFYIIAYGLIRFMDEFLRGDHDLTRHDMTIAQMIGFCILPIGVIYLVTFILKKDTKEDVK